MKTGVQWRMLPLDLAPWQIVYYYFNKWKNEGLLEEIFDTLHGIVRRLSGRAESPSLRIIDSRSIRTPHHIDDQKGIDWNKKIKGRKKHIVVDTFPWLKRILTDGGYRGETVRNTVKRLLRYDLDVVLRADTHDAMLQVAAIKLFLNKI